MALRAIFATGSQNKELSIGGIALYRSQYSNRSLLMASTQDGIPRQYVNESLAKLNIAKQNIDEGLSYFIKEYEKFFHC